MTLAVSNAARLAAPLAAPPTRPGLLDRPELVARLRELSHGRLTLVCAPAGSGKSVLLAAWAATEMRPVAWVSLDTSDCAPDRFARRVAEALRPGRARWRAGELVALVNDLADCPDIVLVLDGYEGDALEPYLDLLPENVHVVVAARVEPPLRLSLRRARGELAELRLDDLRFGAEEIVEVVRRLTNVELDSDEAQLLAERTEGWPAGVHLAALSLRDADDPGRFVRELSGANRHVVDYLREEVLDRQPAEVRDFLLRTSVLDSLPPQRCEALLGGKSSVTLLAAARATGFVDASGQRHRMFRDMLRAELERREPQLARELRRRADAIDARADAPRDSTFEAALAHLAAGRAEEARDAAPGMDPVDARADPAAWARGAAVRSLACDRLRLHAEAAAWARSSAAATERAGRPDGLALVAQGAVLAREGEVNAAEDMFESVVRACMHEPFVRALAELKLAHLRAPRDAGCARALVRGARAAAGGESGLVLALANEVEREVGACARTKRLCDGELTGAELRVARLLSTQLTQREIACELYLSLNTVKTHSRSIYRKLGASSRDDAVRSARALNLV